MPEWPAELVWPRVVQVSGRGRPGPSLIWGVTCTFIPTAPRAGSRAVSSIVIVARERKGPRIGKGYAPNVAAMPQVLVTSEPGSSLIRPSPLQNAFGAQVIGSTARLRLRRLGS